MAKKPASTVYANIIELLGVKFTKDMDEQEYLKQIMDNIDKVTDEVWENKVLPITKEWFNENALKFEECETEEDRNNVVISLIPGMPSFDSVTKDAVVDSPKEEVVVESEVVAVEEVPVKKTRGRKPKIEEAVETKEKEEVQVDAVQEESQSPKVVLGSVKAPVAPKITLNISVSESEKVSVSRGRGRGRGRASAGTVPTTRRSRSNKSAVSGKGGVTDTVLLHLVENIDRPVDELWEELQTKGIETKLAFVTSFSNVVRRIVATIADIGYVKNKDGTTIIQKSL